MEKEQPKYCKIWITSKNSLVSSSGTKKKRKNIGGEIAVP